MIQFFMVPTNPLADQPFRWMNSQAPHACQSIGKREVAVNRLQPHPLTCECRREDSGRAIARIEQMHVPAAAQSRKGMSILVRAR
jgi:hypothetical protein